VTTALIDAPNQRDPALDHLPLYLTHDQPPIGGALKQHPEDFLVEEVPMYLPVGSGEHIYLFVEKRRLSTFELVNIIARHFGVRRSAVGYAGMKDKNAITRQIISIHTPGKTHADYPMLEDDRIGVLWADQHTNKLRLGHLKGNRFSIKLRNVRMTDVLIARRVLDHLKQFGVPNLFGAQRFGMRLDNHILGRFMMLGRFDELIEHLLGPDADMPEMNTQARQVYASGDLAQAQALFPPACRAERRALSALRRSSSPRSVIRTIDLQQRKLWVSALQSAIFNRVLAHRMNKGTLGALNVGDIACKHANGAMFAVDSEVLADPTTSKRLATGEISPSGPLWGAKMMRASGAIDEIECAQLQALGMSIDDLSGADKLTDRAMPGDRRPLRVPLIDPEVEGGVDEHGDYVRCAFELPRGSFATAVTREVMKSALVDVDRAVV